MEHRDVNKSIWSFRDEPKYGVVSAIAVITGCAVFVSFLQERGHYLTLALFLFTFPVLHWAISRMTSGTIVVIDRETGVIQKPGTWPFCALKTWPLREFTSLRVVERTVPVEEGYRIVLYVIMLEGMERSLEVLSTEDEQKGRVVEKELAGFLGLPKDASGVHREGY